MENRKESKAASKNVGLRYFFLSRFVPPKITVFETIIEPGEPFGSAFQRIHPVVEELSLCLSRPTKIID